MDKTKTPDTALAERNASDEAHDIAALIRRSSFQMWGADAAVIMAAVVGRMAEHNETLALHQAAIEAIDEAIGACVDSEAQLFEEEAVQ